MYFYVKKCNYTKKKKGFLYKIDLKMQSLPRLGKLEGSPASEVLPRLGEEKLRLGEPETATKCCFSYYIIFSTRLFFGRAPSTKGALYGYVK